MPLATRYRSGVRNVRCRRDRRLSACIGIQYIVTGFVMAITSCLEKDPAVRPPDAAALRDQLRALALFGEWTEEEKDEIVSDAADSDCGRRR